MVLDQELRVSLSQVMGDLLSVATLIQTSQLFIWASNLADNLKKELHLSVRLVQKMLLEVPSQLLLNGHTESKEILLEEVQKPCVLTLKTTYTS